MIDIDILSEEMTQLKIDRIPEKLSFGRRGRGRRRK